MVVENSFTPEGSVVGEMGYLAGPEKDEFGAVHLGKKIGFCTK